MAVQIQHDGRAPFGSTDWSAGDDGERAAAYSTYNAYCGTFSVPEPGVVVHHVELAIHPDHPGMDKRREFELDGDELTLRTQDVETPRRPRDVRARLAPASLSEWSLNATRSSSTCQRHGGSSAGGKSTWLRPARVSSGTRRGLALSRSGVIACVGDIGGRGRAADALPAERGAVEPVVDR